MILILNGPPGCGKDTIAKILRDEYRAVVTTFKHSLYKETADYYNINSTVVQDLCSSRKTKDIGADVFDGKTPRQALIYVSENVIKPKYGKDYFGKCAAKRITEAKQIAIIPINFIVFSDGGFVEEILPLQEIDDVLVIHLHGRGDFSNDSRNYIVAPGLIHHTDVNLVTGEPRLAARHVLQALNDWHLEFKGTSSDYLWRKP